MILAHRDSAADSLLPPCGQFLINKSEQRISNSELTKWYRWVWAAVDQERLCLCELQSSVGGLTVVNDCLTTVFLWFDGVVFSGPGVFVVFVYQDLRRRTLWADHRWGLWADRTWGHQVHATDCWRCQLHPQTRRGPSGPKTWKHHVCQQNRLTDQTHRLRTRPQTW